MKNALIDRKVGFISGCWDGPISQIPHQGHLYLLSVAKLDCDYLIIGVNNDDYIFRKKKRNAYSSAQIRKQKLLETGLVDQCIIFSGDSPLEIILKYKPNIIYCGNDYSQDDVIGYKECQQWNGKVQIVKRLPNISTTEIFSSK